MSEFKVTWEAHVDADTPEQAAEEAEKIMGFSGEARFFLIHDKDGRLTQVDLDE